MERIKNYSNMLLCQLANEGLQWDEMNPHQQYHSLSYLALSMVCEEDDTYCMEDIHKFAIQELDERMCNTIK
ncbi:MAG: hypothetical protein ACRDD7_01430 [Peptostreptococcaceae bacterium]